MRRKSCFGLVLHDLALYWVRKECFSLLEIDIRVLRRADKRVIFALQCKLFEVNPMKRLPPLNALRAFDLASQLMSFQKAAEALNVTPSALSYQIRQLEDVLGVALFVRHNRSIELTEAGQRLAPGINDAFERIENTVNRLRPQTPENILTISTGPAFAAKWLSPRVHKFIERYPDIELRISASLKLVDFAADGVDVAIRFGGGGYEGLECTEFLPEYVLPLTSQAYIDAHRDANGAPDIRQMVLLHDDSAEFLKSSVNWARWLREMGFNDIDADRGTRFNHADHGLEAAIDGAGIVFGRLGLAIRDMKAGRLIAPFPYMLSAAANFYLCTLPNGQERPKIKAFCDFILEEAEEEKRVSAKLTEGFEISKSR